MGKKKVVIVTGISGQDGSFMVEYLLRNTDCEIYGTVRRLAVKNHKNFEHIQNERFHVINFDLTDAHSITTIIQKLQPDYFINFAAQSFVSSSWDFPRQTFETNATAVLDILEAIRLNAPHCRFYNAGTSEEFGDVAYSPQDEKHPLRPRSPYGASKAAARHLVKVYRESYGLYAVQGWLFNHEGTRRGEEFVTRKVTMGVAKIRKAMMDNKPFQPIELGNMSAKRDWSDAEDFVEGVWMMLNQDVYNPKLAEAVKSMPLASARQKYLSANTSDYVLASGETHMIAEFVEKAFEAADIDAELRFDVPGDWSTAKFFVRNTDIVLVRVNQKFFRPAEVDLLLGNATRVKSELGWQPKTTFSKLIDKMVENDIQQT
jgi:GDPmannose 4,6-dehydratase